MFVSVLLFTVSSVSLLLALRAGRLRRTVGSRAATRAFGWALLPLGSYLAGVLTLAARVGAAFAKWAATLVGQPSAWVGAAMVVTATGLLLMTGPAKPRLRAGSARARRRAVKTGTQSAR